MREYYFVMFWFLLPAIIGFVMARQRGKNSLLWGILSGMFPFFIVILYMQYKPVNKENSGWKPEKN